MVADTDVIIRFLTNDDKKKAEAFENYLRAGKSVILTDVTFAEVYWTLRSFYKFSKPKIIEILKSLISSKSVLSNRNLLYKTLQILEHTNISFIDAYLASYSLVKNEGKVLSYDKGFDKIKQIKRFEP